MSLALLMAASLFSYTDPAASVALNGQSYRVAVHPKEPLILLQVGFAGARKLRGVDHAPVFRAAAETLVAPVGCTITDLDPLGPGRSGTFEARYSCPEGVDLRALFHAQRRALERGEALTAEK